MPRWEGLDMDDMTSLKNNTVLWMTQASKSFDTEAGSPRLLTVKLIQMLNDDSDLDPEDIGIEGEYEVSIISTGSDCVDAGRALDEFHRTVAVACLDDFEAEVYADGRRIYEVDGQLRRLNADRTSMTLIPLQNYVEAINADVDAAVRHSRECEIRQQQVSGRIRDAEINFGQAAARHWDAAETGRGTVASAAAEEHRCRRWLRLWQHKAQLIDIRAETAREAEARIVARAYWRIRSDIEVWGLKFDEEEGQVRVQGR